MALIQVYNPTQATPPEDVVDSTTQNAVFTLPFSSGQTITLTTIGSGVLEGTLVINYMQKLLFRGLQYDYTFDGNQTITLLFGDDPTQYANGEIDLQISYAYYA